MFQMNEIGKSIASARKKKDLTQMELADRMGVTRQAVSSWEMGQTMPDIAKLGDLASILDQSIDELLGNKNISKKVEAIVDNPQTIQSLNPEEAAELAPILKPSQVNQIMKNQQEQKVRIPWKELVQIAPFMDEDLLSEIVMDQWGGETMSYDEIIPLFPFVNESTIAALAAHCNGISSKELVKLAPFMDEDDLGEMVRKSLKEEGGISFEDLVPLAPFLDEDMIADLIHSVIRDGKILTATDIVTLAPFLEEEEITKLALPLLEKEGMSAIIPLMPFLDGDSLKEELYRIYKNKK